MNLSPVEYDVERGIVTFVRRSSDQIFCYTLHGNILGKSHYISMHRHAR